MVAKPNCSVSDTNFILDTLTELRITECLDGQKARKSELFRQVQKLEDKSLKSWGVPEFTELQIKLKITGKA